MQIIRRLDNPLMIKAFGIVPEGGLGVFDSTIYVEETVDNLPENWVPEPEPLPIRDQLKNYYASLPSSQRVLLAPTIKLIMTLAELEDNESLLVVILDAELPLSVQESLFELLGLNQ